MSSGGLVVVDEEAATAMEQGLDLDRERIIIDLRKSPVRVATGLSRNAILFKRKRQFGSLKYRRAPAVPTTGEDLDDRSQVPNNVGDVFDKLRAAARRSASSPGNS